MDGGGDRAIDARHRLLLPRRSLAGCIVAAVVGDTRGVALTPEERINYFPATPFCAVSLFLEGQSLMATDWSADGVRQTMPRPLPEMVFSGPHGGPSASLNPGPVHALTVGFYPDALRRLLDVDVAAFRDRIVPLDAVFGPDLLAVCDAARRTGDADAAFDRLQDDIDPLWRSLRPCGSPASRRLTDWARHLAQRASTTGVGRSLRQIERRTKSWTGQSRRDLAALARLETAFADTVRRLDRDREDWARLALATGFSDQSHLVREVRRVTGFPPADLRRRIGTDPPFWYYRLIGALY